MEFSKNGISILLEKEKGETDKVFYDRGNFIINQPNINNLDFLIKFSKIYVNMKHKNCIYSPNPNKIVKDMESKMKKK